MDCEELRAKYEELDTEELLRLRGMDLVPEALVILDAELVARGMATATTMPPPPPPKEEPATSHPGVRAIALIAVAIGVLFIIEVAKSLFKAQLVAGHYWIAAALFGVAVVIAIMAGGKSKRRDGDANSG